MNSPIRLLLVDAPRLCRRALATLLNRRQQLQVVGEAATGAEALAQARSRQPDLVILEPGIPDGGVKLVADLCREAPTSAVLILTNHNEQSSLSELLQAGARGYLHKECEPDELTAAISRVQAGELVVASGLADAFVRDLGDGRTREPDQPHLTV